MLSSDLISFGLFALRRHKLRTLLTMLGVTIGTATLVISISIGLGVRHVIDEQLRKEDNLRQISVFPSNDGVEENFDGVPDDVLQVDGSMSDARRERIRKIRAIRWKRTYAPAAPKPLTTERIDELRRLPHVVDIIPILDESGRASLPARQKETDARVYGIPHDFNRLAPRVEFGRSFSSADAKECLVHEYALYRLGIRDDADIQAILGSPLRIDLTSARRTPMSLLNLMDAEAGNLTREETEVIEKAWKMFPEFMETIPLPEKERAILLKALRRKKPGAKEVKDSRVSETFTIVGVLRAPVKEDKPDQGFIDSGVRESDVIIPREVAGEFFLGLPHRAESGFAGVRVVVDHEDNLEEAVQAIRKMGLNEFSMGVFIQQMRKNTVLIGFTMDFIALVALIVAVLGIMNTMFTTVLERTREIGILKSLGAKDRHILLIFLTEGALIGLIGGLSGVLLGWLASIPGDGYALSIMRKQGHTPLPESVFSYPIELLLAVPLFAMLLTTLAALLPARRASRVEPVIALRYE